MSELKIPVTSADYIQGDGRITLLEYGDYQCSSCGRAYLFVKQLQNHFKDQIRFVFRNFPFTQAHPYAEAAAETVLFAGKHHLFWEMHDLLYQNQKNLSFPNLLKLAESLGLSSQELEVTLHTKQFEKEIQECFMGGVRSGVNGTPTFFIDNQRYNGPLLPESIAREIEKAYQNQKMQ